MNRGENLSSYCGHKVIIHHNDEIGDNHPPTKSNRSNLSYGTLSKPNGGVEREKAKRKVAPTVHRRRKSKTFPTATSASTPISTKSKSEQYLSNCSDTEEEVESGDDEERRRSSGRGDIRARRTSAPWIHAWADKRREQFRQSYSKPGEVEEEAPPGCKRLNYENVRNGTLTYSDILYSPTCVIHPLSPWKICWDWLILILIYYNTIFTPFFIAFVRTENTSQVSLPGVIESLVDTLFVLDIVFSFQTGYFEVGERLVMDPSMIRHRYLTSGLFLIDFTAAMPVMLIFLERRERNGQIWSVLTLLKLNRLLRVGRLMKRMDQLAAATYFSIIKLLAVFLVFAHWAACASYLLVKLQGDVLEGDQSWVDEAGLRNTDLHKQYIASLYWALTTVSTVGYGDICPNTTAERVLSMVVMLVGAIMYATIIGNVATHITELDAQRREYQRRMKEIRMFCMKNYLPYQIQRRLLDYVDANWEMENGMETNLILRDLPSGAKAEVLVLMYSDLVRGVPLFVTSPSGFIEKCACCFKPQVYLQGDFLMQKGERGAEMIFIVKGMVVVVADDMLLRTKPPWDRAKVLDSHPQLVVAYRGERDFVGEGALISGGRRSCSVLSSSKFCHTLHLLEKDFHTILQQYPEVQKTIKRVVRKRNTIVLKKYTPPKDQHLGPNIATVPLSPTTSPTTRILPEVISSDEEEEGIEKKGEKLKEEKVQEKEAVKRAEEEKEEEEEEGEEEENDGYDRSEKESIHTIQEREYDLSVTGTGTVGVCCSTAHQETHHRARKVSPQNFREGMG